MEFYCSVQTELPIVGVSIPVCKLNGQCMTLSLILFSFWNLKDNNFIIDIYLLDLERSALLHLYIYVHWVLFREVWIYTFMSSPLHDLFVSIICRSTNNFLIKEGRMDEAEDYLSSVKASNTAPLMVRIIAT